MTTRRLAALVALAALGAALPWCASRVPPAPIAPTANGDGAVARPERTVCDAARSDARRNGGDALARESAVDPNPATWTAVLVVDEHGEPVAGAHVSWTAREWRDQELGFAPFDVEVELASEPAVTTAADGVAVLTVPGRRAFVWARAGERFGQALLELGEPLLGAPRLELHRDVTVRAAVRGESEGSDVQWPLDARQLIALERRNQLPAEPDGTWVVGGRGTYLLVPHVHRGDAARALHEHAVQFDVDVLGTNVRVALAVPAEVVRAALLELGR
jgi:hypothetical protein